jgi:outer membrane protein TolC
MKTLSVVLGLSALLLAGAAAPAHAQNADKASAADQARIDLLAKQAAQRFAVADAGTPQTQDTQPITETGPKVELTLEDATMRALERNLNISVERLNPEVQDLNLARIRSAYRPTVTSTITQRSQVQPPTSQLNGGTIVTNDTNTYNAGLQQNIPWGGGNVTLAFNNQKQVTNNSFSNFNPAFNSNVTATYTQPLLRSFTIDGNRQQLKVTILNRDISEAQLKGTIAATTAAVRNAYWELLYSTQALDVAKSSLDLANKLVEDNRARVQVGTMAPLDVVQSQAEAATRQQAVVQAEGLVRTDELALKRLIVNGTDDPMWHATLVPVDRPTFSPAPLDVETAVKTALANRTDLEAARKTMEANDISLKFLHNQTLPQVDFVGMYEPQGVGGTFFQRSGTGLGSTVTQVIPGGYGDALSSLFNRTYPIWQAQVNISYPIGGSQADAAYARGKVQRSQAEAQLRSLELQVATDVTSAALQVQTSLKSYQAAQAARDLAQQQMMAEQSRFEVGLSTNYNVVLTQRDLANAQNAELRALLDYRKAQVNYELVQAAPSAGSTNITAVSATGF